jgi:hypothetical protein
MDIGITYVFTELSDAMISGFPLTNEFLVGVSWSVIDLMYIFFYIVPSLYPPEIWDAMFAFIDVTRKENDGSLNFAGLCKVSGGGMASLNQYGWFGLVGYEPASKNQYLWFYENYYRGGLYHNVDYLLETDFSGLSFGGDQQVAITDPVPESRGAHSAGMIRLSEGSRLWWENNWLVGENPRETLIPNYAWFYTEVRTTEYNRQGVVTSFKSTYTGPQGFPPVTQDYGWWEVGPEWGYLTDPSYMVRIFRDVHVFQQIYSTYYAPDGYIHSTTYDYYYYTMFRYVAANGVVTEVQIAKDAISKPVSCVAECGEGLLYVIKSSGATYELRRCVNKTAPLSYTTILSLPHAIDELYYHRSRNLIFTYQSAINRVVAYDLSGAIKYSRDVLTNVGAVKFTESN